VAEARGDAGLTAAASKLEVIAAYVDAFNRRDLEQLRELSTEDSEYHSMLVSGEGVGLYRGHDGIARYVADVDEAFDEWHTEDSSFVESETGRVLHLYRIVGKGRGSGVPIDLPMAIVWTVEDGKMKVAKVFRDRSEAMREAGVDEDGNRIEEDA
jgi:ketosteroid isomerase-like protein